MSLAAFMRSFFGVDVENIAKTPAERRADYAKARTAELEARGLCVQGPLPPDALKVPSRSRTRVQHGPVVPGTNKCQRCNDIHNKAAA